MKRTCRNDKGGVRYGAVGSLTWVAGRYCYCYVLASSQSREAVGAPLFTPHAGVDEKESGRVIVPFPPRQSWIVWPPEGLLPRRREEIAFRHIGARLRDHLQQCIHGLADGTGVAARHGQIGGVAGDAGERWRAGAGADREREGIEHRGIRGGVLSRCHLLRGGTGQPFVEMQRHPPVPGTGEQGIGKVRLLLRL